MEGLGGTLSVVDWRGKDLRGWRVRDGMRLTGEEGGARRDICGLDLPGGESREAPDRGGLAGLGERDEEVALVVPERRGVGRARLVLGVRWCPTTGRGTRYNE